MKLINRSLLEKLKKKQRGNQPLIQAIERLISDIEHNEWNSQLDLKKTRPDADCVHSDGFYFFNLNVHRTMILIEFDDDKRARVIWAGSHSDYEKVFKNNRNAIKKWLRNNELI